MANEMRDRLVELLLNGEKQFFDTKANRTTPLQSYLSNYLIKNGVVVPPCKVGDVVYKLMDVETPHSQILELRVLSISIEEAGIRFACRTVKKYRYNFDTLNFEDFDKWVFLTKSEAEQKLKEMRGAE